jgi:hypothetical protein
VVRKKWPFRFYLSFSTKWPCVCGQVTTSVWASISFKILGLD